MSPSVSIVPARAALALALLAAGCAPASAPQTPTPAFRAGPGCAAPGVLAQIRREADIRGGALRLIALDQVSETGFAGTPDPRSPWRWCLGRARLSDGRHTEARWILRKPGGGATGLGFGWCIAGLSHAQCGHLGP